MNEIKKSYIFILIIILTVILTFSSFGKAIRDQEKIQQIKVGNFSLSASMQPVPLISFGQNIIDKGDVEVFSYISQLKGSKTKFREVIPSILYGVTDTSSLFVQLPIAAQFKSEKFCSRGVQDFLLQFEYAFYTHETSIAVNQLTCLANIGVPTGSSSQNPPTGFGALSFFIGLTASHMATDWYCFTSSGIELPTSHKNTKFGKQFLYEFGVGRNIAYRSDKWIFLWLIELNGEYEQASKIKGFIDPNSGGNSLFLGPSLWFSTQRIILQLGISGVIYQHLFGSQPKDSYFVAADFGWRF